MTINVLEWITCIHCGTNFQVSVPNYARGIYPSEELRDDVGFESYSTQCPQCGKKLCVNILLE